MLEGMCGITGILNTPAPIRTLQQMTTTLQHRGPDDEGFAFFNYGDSTVQLAGGVDTPDSLQLPLINQLPEQDFSVGLGHRRLSILDLSPNGHNPLPNSDQSLWITYNGEIYNYIELREELTALGYQFRSGADTEVLLAAYEEWGHDCLARFNGMFAFAIWDSRRQELFCARDRFGIKPFYFYNENRMFAFASEIKSLLANPHIPANTNPQAIYDYLVNGAIVAQNTTFFDDIQQLLGGYALTVKPDGRCHMWRYYDLTYNTRFTGANYPDKVAQFHDLLTDAVRLRLRSDVAIGSSLSGGLDSSSVVTIANQLLQAEQGVNRSAIGDQQQVFCAIYDGEAFNEKPFMDVMIQHTGAQAHFTEPNAEHLWHQLEKMVWHQDEPVASTSIFAQYCVMQLAREHGITVLLDGQGGDEVLAGYHFYYGYHLAHALHVGRIDRFIVELYGARRAGVSWLNLVALTGWNISPEPMRRIGWRLGGAQLLSHKPIDAQWVNTTFKADHHVEAKLKHRAYPTLQQKLYDDVFHTNLPTLLRYEDRSSMAFHIEARVPLLDHRLVEFAFSLSADAHIQKGWSKTLLRDAMKGALPEKIRLRKDKEGYTTPHKRWMAALTPHINSLFQKPHSERYLSQSAIQRLQSAEAAEINGVWRLINLESWLRAFALD